jgi:DNA-binding transcriptional LysR family regulator
MIETTAEPARSAARMSFSSPMVRSFFVRWRPCTAVERSYPTGDLISEIDCSDIEPFTLWMESAVRFKGLDLNLLAALDVLLAERNVTKAASRLHLSQPATSSALARLREYFGDELLIPSGRTMLPTPHAEALRPLIRDVLGDVERLVAASTRFDPSRSDRQFRIVGSDYIVAVLLAPLMARLQSDAPNLRFQIEPPSPSSIPELLRGDVDLFLTPRQFIAAGHPAELIFEEPHVVVGWKGNPVFRSPLGLSEFLAHPHVVVEIGPSRATPFAEQHMAKMGLKRRIDVIAPSFAAVPWMLPHTTRLAVMHERLARTFTVTLPLQIAPLPFEMPIMQEMAQYHATRDTDEGLQWLLGRIKAFATSSA